MTSTLSFDHAVPADRATPPADTPWAERPARNLRRVLAVNATSSGVAGLAGLVAASWWAETLGIDRVGWVQVVSVAFIVFAVDVGLVAARATRSLRTAALAVSICDISYVIATVVVLATVDLTTAGAVIAVAMGLLVVDFAALQLRYRSRLA
jgi:hypothetical protein